MKIATPEKKKTPLDWMRDLSGSHTADGFRPESREKRIISGSSPRQVRCEPPDLLTNIERIISIASIKIPKTPSGSAMYNELCLIKSEAEQMRCLDLSNPQTYNKCRNKLTEFNKRLDALMGGIP